MNDEYKDPTGFPHEIDWNDGKRQKHTCVLCGVVFTGFGNNPEPLRDYEEGRCCDNCNTSEVIPARLRRITRRR